jgi:hypothetical protein
MAWFKMYCGGAKDGSARTLYLDKNFNPTFALLHSYVAVDATEWPGVDNGGRRVHVYVLAPIDLDQPSRQIAAILCARDQIDPCCLPAIYRLSRAEA